MNTIVIGLLLLSLMVSCEKPSISRRNHQIQVETEDQVILLSPACLELSPEGASLQVNILTSDYWEATFVLVDKGWCSASPLSGAKGYSSISIVADENNTDTTRRATLSISSGKGKVEIAISQYYIERLSISQCKLSIGPESQSVGVTVESNVSVNVDMPQECSWIRLDNGYLPPVYSFLVEGNYSQESRTAVISFHGGKTQLSQTLTIIQNKNDNTNPEFESNIIIPGFDDNDW